MRGYAGACSLLAVVALLLALHGVNGGNPYRYYTWKITYGDIYPLGVKQQVQFRSIPLSLSLCFLSGAFELCGMCVAGNLD